MMKKNGFTLAEVLITLAIIGVVATLTLPALMTNTGEQQYVTGFKKALNTLTEAAQMNEAISGFNYDSLATASVISTAGQEEQSLYGLLANRASVDFIKTDDGTKYNTVLHNGSENFAIFFRDGSAILFPKSITSTTGSNATILSDGLPYGLPVVYDVNGLKGPNTFSHCGGATTGVAVKVSADPSDTGSMDVCNDKKNRIIRDQFAIRLRGGIAVPNGRAAQWAFNR